MKSLSCVWLFATPWAVAYQAPPSMKFSRQEYWSRLLFPSFGDFSFPHIVSFAAPSTLSNVLLLIILVILSSKPKKKKKTKKKKDFLMWTIFRLYWICYNIASVLYFAFLVLRHVGSWLPHQGWNSHHLHWKAKSSPLDCHGSPQVNFLSSNRKSMWGTLFQFRRNLGQSTWTGNRPIDSR